MRKIRVGDLARVPLLGVTVIATANPCKIERVGAIPSISTNFLRGEAPVTLDASGDPAGVPFALFSRSSVERAAAAKLKAAGAIPAVGATLWIVNAAAGGTCLENRWNSLVRGLG
jgi:hypothetical protein